MSVIGGVLLFAAGLAIGGGLVSYNHACVSKAVKGLIREKEQLRQELNRLEMLQECAGAHRYGREYERTSSKLARNDLAGLADAFGGRTVKFGDVKRGV